MPDKCCVPNCNSNYPSKGGYTPVFRFPSDENLRQDWIKKIPRKDWKPSKWSVVCINLFHEGDIIKVEKYKDSSGECKERPLGRLKLASGALPTIFPDLPSYLSTSKTKKRSDPEERRVKQSEALEVKAQELLEKDTIKYFPSFAADIHNKPQRLKDWFIYTNCNSVVVYQCNFENISQVTVSVKIQKDMTCEVCVNQNILSRSAFISNNVNEDIFLKCQDQKRVLIIVSKTVLFGDTGFSNDVCPYGVEITTLCEKILSVIANVLLNNYSRARNDSVDVSKLVYEKRKLQTLYQGNKTNVY